MSKPSVIFFILFTLQVVTVCIALANEADPAERGFAALAWTLLIILNYLSFRDATYYPRRSR